MIIDFEGHRILIKDKIVYLTKTENNILRLLYNNKNKVIKYNEIINKIYGAEEDKYYKNAIIKHISSLNNKIKQCIKIKNIRDVGYIIEEDFK